MPFDQSVAYYWTSLGLSAAAVILFLWLVRTPRRPAGRPEASPPAEDAPAPLDPQKASRADN
ncbi:MAG TPA: hypothetical protein VIZ69_05055 [Thermoanaerobaculia bacterium]